MTPAIIPVTNIQEALRRALPGAMKMYQDDTPEVAASLFRSRFGQYPPVIFTWQDIREIVKAGKLVTISAEMCGIPCTREVYEGGAKLPLDVKG